MKHNEPKNVTRKPRRSPSLPKAPTGIQGLDELTGGGYEGRRSRGTFPPNAGSVAEEWVRQMTAKGSLMGLTPEEVQGESAARSATRSGL